MAGETFTVDTHLFRELGELLVGRESTALVELIKNAYDADAKEALVHGEHLDNPKLGLIRIADDGVGMTPKRFREGFLRIASRLKDAGNRRSVRYRRKFTGAKGIGRLAAHKLARELNVYSIPSQEVMKEDNQDLGLDATIDWDAVEKEETLEDLFGKTAIQVKEEILPKPRKEGTTINLRRLRKKWTATERAKFFAEVGAYSPPKSLVGPLIKETDSPLLFDTPKISDTRGNDPGFNVKLTGDFEAGEDYWPALVQAAQWVIEIKAEASDSKVHFNIIPTKKGKAEFPDAKPLRLESDHPNPAGGPFFEARILIREGGGGTRAEKAWLGRASGIRVFMEGFRVLPYGEPNDDWLSIDADYKKRQKALTYIAELPEAGEPVDEEEGLLFLGNSAYFGGVFLTLDRSPNMKMLINREGFVPGTEIDSLVHILRTAVYLSVRVRAAAKRQLREDRSEKRRFENAEVTSKLGLTKAVQVSISRANELAQEARKRATAGDMVGAQDLIERAGHEFQAGSVTAERLMTERNMLRILASVGTQMAAFVHEINGLLGAAISIENAVSRLRQDLGISSAARKHLAELHVAIGDLRRSVERQAVYLTDVISPDARRRRSRQKLSERFDAGVRLVSTSAQKRGISIVNSIPYDLKSPPMFPAEMTLVFSNLLTNAVKAAGKNGRIRATAQTNSDGNPILKIENTGVAVDLNEAERWFTPFESTTVETDPILGQGMGMGLPITRNILEEYGAAIEFVKPSYGFASAIQIVFAG